MRGRALRPLLGGASVCLVVLIMVNPVAALPGLAKDPGPGAPPVIPDAAAGASGSDHPWAWVATEGMDHVPARAIEEVERFGRSPIPRPDEIPAYDRLPEAAQREAWFVYMELSLRALRTGQENPWRYHMDEPIVAGQDQGEDETPAEGLATLGDPRGLRPIWSLDSHGSPRALHPADDAGATFLVTSRGVLRFAAPDTVPEWMVKPGGYISKTETGHANGDGVLDIVIGRSSWMASEEDSVIVVDGATGEVIWSGLDLDKTLVDWALTDIDGDGIHELIGMDQLARIIAINLDGTERYHMAPEGMPGAETPPIPLIYAGLAYQAEDDRAFADVDADGVLDFVLTGYYVQTLQPVVGSFDWGEPVITTLSGVTGGVIWRLPVDPFSYSWLASTGDANGDGATDLLLITETQLSLPAIYDREIRYTLRSGPDGMLLAEDRTRIVYLCPTDDDCQQVPVGDVPYYPQDMADLDGDGADEVIVVEYHNDQKAPWTFSGRAYVTPGGPMEEVWRHTLTLDAAYDEVEGENLMFRDVNGDGKEEAVLQIYTASYTDEEALEDLAVHVFTLDATGIKGGRMAEILGFWDIDATGQAYGWTLRDDRWRSMGEGGVAAGDGFRLVTTTYPMVFHDETGDKIPDLMMRKTVGFMWIDGRTGRLLEDVERPFDSYISGLYKEGSKYRLLERNWGDGTYTLLDLKTLEPIWTVAREEFEDGSFYGLLDLDGDNRLDLLVSIRTYETERFEGPFGEVYSYTYSRQTGIKVVAASTLETMYEVDTREAYPRFDDVLPQERGTEIVLRDSSGEDTVMELHVWDESEPRWTYEVGSASYRTTEDGYLLLMNRQEGEVYEILSADNGELVASYPLPADGFASDYFFMRIDGDRFPDLIMSIAVEEAENEYSQEMIVYDWAREKEMSRFPLVTGQPVTYYFGDFSYTFGTLSYISDIVGDWDGDGLADFAYREDQRPVVRSSADGSVLALAPGKGTIIETPDLNVDGRKDVAIYSDTGRLRFFDYDPKAVVIEEDGEDEVRTITSPEGAETEAAAKDFFNDVDDEGLPGPALPLVLAALAAMLVVLRRRR